MYTHIYICRGTRMPTDAELHLDQTTPESGSCRYESARCVLNRSSPWPRGNESLLTRSRFQDNCFSVLRRGSKEVSYLRLVYFCITHL